ncbi:hypothetical protein U1Q18_024154 [Sarracenia purpurea var. burkii]
MLLWCLLDCLKFRLPDAPPSLEVVLALGLFLSCWLLLDYNWLLLETMESISSGGLFIFGGALEVFDFYLVYVGGLVFWIVQIRGAAVVFG